MGNTIYKLGDDEYAIWSSITESPTMWGTRERLTGFLVTEGIEDLRRSIGERFARADESGTSSLIRAAMISRGYETHMFQQKGVLHISNLKEFIDSFDAETQTFDESWIEPLDDPDCLDRRVARADQNGPYPIKEKIDVPDHS